jgi:hypothetical protein
MITMSSSIKKTNLNGYFELHSLSDDQIFSALDLLNGYWKTISILYLRLLRLPILNGLIITELNSEVMDALNLFCMKYGYIELLLRHDRRPEIPTYPSGGYLVKFSELEKEIDKFLKDNRIVILLEPKSPYEDLYSVNILFDRDSEEILLEIVGPGFDASDLNRGHISPHEIIKANLYKIIEDNYYPKPKNTFRTFLVDNARYQSSVFSRKIKIGNRITKNKNIALKKPSDHNLIKLAEEYLTQNNHQLLLSHEKSYSQIPDDYLRQIYSHVAHLPKRLKDIANKNPLFVVSLGFLNPDKRLVFWDIVWPNLKYKID